MSRFQSTYTHQEELSIDEIKVLWRGRLRFKQCLPGKRYMSGFKLKMLCDSSRYVLNVLVYCEKSFLILISFKVGHHEVDGEVFYYFWANFASIYYWLKSCFIEKHMLVVY